MAEQTHVLVTGGSGQVGTELKGLTWPEHVVVHTPGRRELDLADAASVRAAFDRMPLAAVINAGAYTAVDRAESDVAAAFAANGMGPAVLAELTRKCGIPMIQISTDYVFDGAGTDAHREDDAVGPLGVYGASKLAGELAVRTGNPRSVVLRTAWVLSASGSNFLKTMLRLAADRPQLRVVADQYGCPTGARDIAETLRIIALRMIVDPAAPTGIYHFVNGGEATWADLAREIFALSAAKGGPTAEVEAITSAEYPTPARRPSNSRLSTRKISRDYAVQPRGWQQAVAEIVDSMLKEGEQA